MKCNAFLCSLDLRRKALLPKVLNVVGAEAVLRSAFKSPCPNAPAQSDVSSSLLCMLPANFLRHYLHHWPQLTYFLWYACLKALAALISLGTWEKSRQWGSGQAEHSVICAKRRAQLIDGIT